MVPGRLEVRRGSVCGRPRAWGGPRGARESDAAAEGSGVAGASTAEGSGGLSSRAGPAGAQGREENGRGSEAGPGSPAGVGRRGRCPGAPPDPREGSPVPRLRLESFP